MDKLEQFYLSKENNFSRLLNALEEAGIYSECSHPQIMALWENEDIPKIMIVGQEPYGWEASEESIKGLMAEYKRFNLGENYYNSPFWSWSWWIAKELGYEGAHPFLYNNINKISAVGGGRASSVATNLENTYFRFSTV